MRITNKSMNINLLRNLNQGLKRYDRLSEQLVSGRKVHRPSDSPATISNIMDLNSSLIETEQYLRGAADAQSWLESTDSALDSLTNVLHRLRDIITMGANDTQDDAARFALAQEAEQLFDSIIQLGNSTHGSKYIFAGQLTTVKPFVRKSDDPNTAQYFEVSYQGGYRTATGDLVKVEFEVSTNSYLTVNVADAEEVEVDGVVVVEERLFTPILNLIKEVRENLINNNVTDLSNQNLGDLEQTLDRVLRHRADVGARMARADLAEERLQDLRLNFNKLLKNVQGVDYAETIMQLKNEEHIYRTALSVGARILQPSLVDFLR